MIFKLRQGPWTTVFEGKFLGHEVELLQNEEGLLLTVIYEKEGEETRGMLLQAFTLFHAIGEVQGFVEGLGNEALTFSRHDGKSTIHFLIAGSKPEYSRVVEESVTDTVDRLIEQARQRGKRLSNISKTYELQLTPLQECSRNVKQIFFSQPFIIPLLQKVEQGKEQEPAAELVSEPRQGEAIILGITKDEKQVKEPLLFFKNTLVEGKPEQERLHFLCLLIESALISNIVVIIFDEGHYFDGLRRPNRNVPLLQRYKVAIEPIGFPVKNFKAADDIKVDLSSVSIEGLMQTFGCPAATCQLVHEGIENKGIQSMEKLIETVNTAKGQERTFLFERNRVKRIIKLIEVLYPGLFGAGNDMQQIARGWFKAIGRASVIQVDGLDGRARAVLVNSFLNELAAFFKQRHGKGELEAIVVLPNAAKIFPRKQTILSKDSVNALKLLQQTGVGFAMTADRILDLDAELAEMADATVSIVKANDAAIQLKGRKSYRVLLRPGLSECTGDRQTGQK